MDLYIFFQIHTFHSSFTVCGDNFTVGDEQCDGGTGCTSQCKCDSTDGFSPFNPVRLGCNTSCGNGIVSGWEECGLCFFALSHSFIHFPIDNNNNHNRNWRIWMFTILSMQILFPSKNSSTTQLCNSEWIFLHIEHFQSNIIFVVPKWNRILSVMSIWRSLHSCWIPCRTSMPGISLWRWISCWKQTM